MRLEELEQVAKTNFSIRVQVGLCDDVIAEPVTADLVQDQFVELSTLALVYCRL